LDSTYRLHAYLRHRVQVTTFRLGRNTRRRRTTMKAYELQAKEGPGALVLVERKEEALGPADVRVRVRATSINYRDLIIFRGAKNRSAPVVPLSDGAGE